MEVVQITNFKKGGVSFGFTKNYLQSRLGTFRSQVFGESPQESGKAVAPHKLNLIQRIMKNVTTPVLIQHSRDASASETASLSSEANLPKLTSALILRYIEKASHQFETKLEEVRSQGKGASDADEHMMSFFKFPNATYLTNTLF